MRRVSIHLVLCLSIVSSIAKGQGELLENVEFDNVIQNIFPQPEYDVDYSDLYDRLFSLYSSPISLNEANREDFQSLYFLNEEQINGIVDYREKFGQFKTIFELMSIEGFDREVVEQLNNFIRIDSGEEYKLYRSLFDPTIHELFLRYQGVVEQKKGYTQADTLSNGSSTTRYAGGPARLYGRYLFAKPNQYSFGLTFEKDPGEQLIWDPSTKRYGMDYYSFHLMIENTWKFKKIIVGDFSLDYGQGLIFGSGFRVGKGAEPVTTIRRNGMGLKPYRSVYEGKDYSGLAVAAQFKLVNLNLFISNTNRDAKLRVDDNIDSELFTTYINEVGLHRTPYEIESKHSISNHAYGGNLNVKLIRSKLEIGLNAVYNGYSADIVPVYEKYRVFQFRGKTNYNVGSYVNYYFKKGHLFSELALSKSGGIAHSSGLIVSLSSHLQTAIHYRNYSKNYHVFLGNAFAENISSINEQGIYWGVSMKPTKKLLITGYFDYFSFPWLKYRVDAPSIGQDFMFSINYYLDPKTTVIFQYRSKVKYENQIDDSEPIINIISRTTSRYRVDFSHQISNAFSIKTWIQSSKSLFDDEESHGFMLAQDVSFSMKKLSLAGRFALFESDSYDSRLYMYERDLLYVYSVPSFSNKGVRYYLMCKYDASRLVSVWVRFAQTNYFNVGEIGSGLEQIQGNTKTNISFQTRFKF